LGVGVKHYNQVAAALLTNYALSDSPLSRINRPIAVGLCPHCGQTAANRDKREQGERRQNHISSYVVSHDFSFAAAD
jgi:hypothetical protein